MQTIQITLECPRCSGVNIVKNGQKSYSGAQNYLCKDCGRQFITDHDKLGNGCKKGIDEKMVRMVVRGCGVRDIADIEGISIGKVLSVIDGAEMEIRPC